MLLDVCNPEVQDFMFGIVDNLLGKHPQIAYIKWDANVELKNYGSTYLPQDKQSHSPLMATSQRNLIGMIRPVWWLGEALTCEAIATAG